VTSQSILAAKNRGCLSFK